MKKMSLSNKIYKMLIPIVLLGSVFCFAGCSDNKSEATPKPTPDKEDITIYYQADDGEFRKDTYSTEPKEDREQAIEKEKTIISLYCGGSENRSLNYLVTDFNRENPLFYVEMTQFPYDMEFQSVQERLRIDVSAGKGPDVMTLDIFPVSEKIIADGYLLDMAPLMEKSNITDDKYFPAYKAVTSGDKVYGICPSMEVVRMSIDEEVLPDKEIPDLEALVDILLDYSESAIFLNDYQEGIYIMDYFLCGSEDLWGMIDWKNKTCDFSTELFSKILEVCKKYADNRNKGYEPIMRMEHCYMGLYPGQEAIEKEGRVMLDYYFDDGNYPKYNSSVETLVINADTSNLEATWAFVSYVMSKTGQSYSAVPTHRELFTEQQTEHLKDIEAGKAYTLVDFTEEVMLDSIQVFETGKYCPTCTEEILNIIYEEAGAYFSGDKGKDEVIRIIQSRVQILLDEY